MVITVVAENGAVVQFPRAGDWEVAADGNLVLRDRLGDQTASFFGGEWLCVGRMQFALGSRSAEE